MPKSPNPGTPMIKNAPLANYEQPLLAEKKINKNVKYTHQKYSDLLFEEGRYFAGIFLEKF